MKVTVEGTKALPTEIAAETGFKIGLFVTEEVHNEHGMKCDFVDEHGRRCDEEALAYENKIVGAIDGDGNVIKLSEIEAVDKIILQTANQIVGLCVGHIIKVVDDDTIRQHVKRNDDAGKT